MREGRITERIKAARTRMSAVSKYGIVMYDDNSPATSIAPAPVLTIAVKLISHNIP